MITTYSEYQTKIIWHPDNVDRNYTMVVDIPRELFLEIVDNIECLRDLSSLILTSKILASIIDIVTFRVMLCLRSEAVTTPPNFFA